MSVDLSQIPNFFDDEPNPNPPVDHNPNPPADDNPNPDQPKYVTADEYERLQARYQELATEFREVRDRPVTVKIDQPLGPPQQQQDPAQLRGQLKEYFGRRMLEDQGDALVEAAMLGATMATQNLESKFKTQLASRDTTTIGLMIDSFKSRKAAEDPDGYRLCAKEFGKALDGMPKDQLSSLPDAQRNAVLEMAYKAAKGEVYDRMYAEAAQRRAARKDTPPNYGDRGAPSGGGGRRNVDPDFLEAFGDVLDADELSEALGG